MGLTLRERYADSIGEMMKHSTASAKIDETKVYEEANMVTRQYMNALLDENLSDDSCLVNVENFKAFYEDVAKNGKSGLILMEHYTNLDLPEIIYLLEKINKP